MRGALRLVYPSKTIRSKGYNAFELHKPIDKDSTLLSRQGENLESLARNTKERARDSEQGRHCSIFVMPS